MYSRIMAVMFVIEYSNIQVKTTAESEGTRYLRCG